MKCETIRTNTIVSIENVHARAALKSFPCLHWHEIPKIWRRALVVTIPKLMKCVENPKSYRPVSLLCVPCKILGRLIYASVKLIIVSLLLIQEAAFPREKSTVDQVILLKESIEHFLSILRQHMTLSGIVALPANCMRLLPDKHMVRMIMELVWNRSFTLTAGDSSPSRILRL